LKIHVKKNRKSGIAVSHESGFGQRGAISSKIFFGKDRGRRLDENAPTTDNAAQRIILRPMAAGHNLMASQVNE
jgi:hypothetical protein